MLGADDELKRWPTSWSSYASTPHAYGRPRE